jgi:hypothetical protein
MKGFIVRYLDSLQAWFLVSAIGKVFLFIL